MSEYKVLIGFSQGQGTTVDPDRVIFMTDVFSESFKFRRGDVIKRADIPEYILGPMQIKGLIEPYMKKDEGQPFHFKPGEVVSDEVFGIETQKLLDLGLIESVKGFFDEPFPPEKKRKKRRKKKIE